MFIIRKILGAIILFFNFIFSPSSPNRSEDEQVKIDDKTKSLSLYQLPSCPFCVKVRRTLKREGLNIELRNINKNETYREELIKEGGKRTVPCLRIEKEDGKVQWLYESNDVVSYLQNLVKTA